MTTAEVAVQNILKHTGVKGMKWGIRKKATAGPRGVTVRDKGKKIKTSGGEGHPAHPEAVRARTTGQIVKKSGVKAISDNDLRSYSNRLQLEQNVKRLQYNEKNAAQRFVARVLGRAGETTTQNAANAGAAKVGKRALTLVAAAA
jgi:hypothetical protein